MPHPARLCHRFSAGWGSSVTDEQRGDGVSIAAQTGSPAAAPRCAALLLPERDRHPLGNLCCGPAVRCHPQTSLLSGTVLSPAHGCRQSRDLPAPAASRPVTPGAGVTAQPCRVHLSTDRTSLKEKPITCIPAGFRIKLHTSERKSASPWLGPGTSNCTRTPTAGFSWSLWPPGEPGLAVAQRPCHSSSQLRYHPCFITGRVNCFCLRQDNGQRSDCVEMAFS